MKSEWLRVAILVSNRRQFVANKFLNAVWCRCSHVTAGESKPWNVRRHRLANPVYGFASLFRPKFVIRAIVHARLENEVTALFPLRHNQWCCTINLQRVTLYQKNICHATAEIIDNFSVQNFTKYTKKASYFRCPLFLFKNKKVKVYLPAFRQIHRWFLLQRSKGHGLHIKIIKTILGYAKVNPREVVPHQEAVNCFLVDV